ncbi:hypothetical protein ACQ86D_19875 [Streptomyces galilaeus]
MTNRESRANLDNGVRLGDRTDARAAVDDRGRGLFAGLAVLFVVLLAVGSLVVLGRSAAGRGEAIGGLRVAAAALGLVVAAGAVWLIVRARRAQRWVPLLIACGGCLGWMAVMALVGRI